MLCSISRVPHLEYGWQPGSVRGHEAEYRWHILTGPDSVISAELPDRMMSRTFVGMLAAATATLLATAQPHAQAARDAALANVLRVGPDRELKRPSEAARVARDG